MEAKKKGERRGEVQISAERKSEGGKQVIRGMLVISSA